MCPGDITPDNILMTLSGDAIKIIDWGVAMEKCRQVRHSPLICVHIRKDLDIAWLLPLLFTGTGIPGP